jgi:hypothetical protein
VALLEMERGSVSRRTREAADTRSGQPNVRRKAAFEFFASFLVLMGIAIGILVLRFALDLMHGVLH